MKTACLTTDGPPDQAPITREGTRALERSLAPDVPTDETEPLITPVMVRNSQKISADIWMRSDPSNPNKAVW
jgi:hypothetical protein